MPLHHGASGVQQACSQPQGEIRHPSNPAQFQNLQGMRGTLPARCHLFCRRLGTLHLQGRDKQKFLAGPSLNNACTQYKSFRGITKKLKGQLHVQWTAHCTVARRRGDYLQPRFIEFHITGGWKRRKHLGLMNGAAKRARMDDFSAASRPSC